MGEGIGGGGRLSPPSPRVKVKTASAGVSVHTDRDGNQTILKLIDIEVAWGIKPGDRWQGVLVKDPGVVVLLEKIKGRSPHSAKLYASKLPLLAFLDYRYGACDQVIRGDKSLKFVCNAPLVAPGLDGYKCSKCGWVQRVNFALAKARSGRKQQRPKEKTIEQVPLAQLPSAQLDLFAECEPISLDEPVEDAVEVWQISSEEDHELASQELLESYQVD